MFIEIIINLSLSLVLVHYIGISGVLLATALSLLISEYLIKPFILNKHIFKDKIIKYYLENFIYIIYIIGMGYIVNKVTLLISINNLLIWFIWGISITLVNFLITLIYYYFILRKREFIVRTLCIIRGKKYEV